MKFYGRFYSIAAMTVGLACVLSTPSRADIVGGVQDGFDQYIDHPTTCDGYDCSHGLTETTDRYGVHMFTVFHGVDGTGPIQKGSPFGFTIGGSPNAFGQIGPDNSGIEFELPRLVSTVSIDASQYDLSEAEFLGLWFQVLDKDGNVISDVTETSYASGLLPGYGEKVLTFTTPTNEIAALVDDYTHHYGIYFDNLEFGYADDSLVPAATPEPATLGLFAICCLGAGALRVRANVRRVPHSDSL